MDINLRFDMQDIRSEATLPLRDKLARSAGFGEAPQQADFCVLAARPEHQK